MINISFAKEEHIKLIAEFEKSAFNNEAYTYENLKDDLTDNYLLKNNENIFVITDNDCLIGYMIFHIEEDFTDLYKIFIIESERNKDYASNMISKLESLAKRYNSKKIMVEVRENNTSAINFYKKNNFINISIRNNYYKNPIDNALIFEKIL